jgi:hypothetical protein
MPVPVKPWAKYGYYLWIKLRGRARTRRVPVGKIAIPTSVQLNNSYI